LVTKKKMLGGEEKTMPRKSWEPSREIPSGAVKGRVSSYRGKVTSERTKPKNNSTTFTLTKTKNTTHDSLDTTSARDKESARENEILKAEKMNDDDQWIIPDRNIGNTQVFASDWGEAMPAKSAESDDWETPGREWIRSGETKTDTLSVTKMKKNSTDLPGPLNSSQKQPARNTSVSKGEIGNMLKPLTSSSVKKTIPNSLVPPLKDDNFYENAKERSLSNNKREQEKAFDVNSSSLLFDNFNDDFETFPTMLGMYPIKNSTSNGRFQTNEIQNQEILNKPSDAFGFPISSDNAVTESQNIGEIVSGDEFFDTTVQPNDYVRPSSDDLSFELNNYSDTTSEVVRKDASHILNEVHSVKSDSKKKKKGFFKGLFGRKGKDKEYGKIKQPMKDSNKSNTRQAESSKPKGSMKYIPPQSNLRNANASETQDLARSSKKEKFASQDQKQQDHINLNNAKALNQSKTENNDNDHKSDKSNIEQEEIVATFDKRSTVDFKKSYNSSFKESVDKNFPSIGDINKVMVSSNANRDDIFDDVESIEKKSAGDAFLDPELDHLDSNVDSEEDSNGEITSIRNENLLSLSTPSAAPQNQKVPRHHQPASEFPKSDISRFRIMMNETKEEVSKSLSKKKFSDVEVLSSTMNQKVGSMPLDYEPIKEKSERRCDSGREISFVDDTKVSNAKRDEPSPPEDSFVIKVKKTQPHIDGSKALRINDNTTFEKAVVEPKGKYQYAHHVKADPSRNLDSVGPEPLGLKNTNTGDIRHKTSVVRSQSPEKRKAPLHSKPRRKYLSNTTDTVTNEIKSRSKSYGKTNSSTKSQEISPYNTNVVLRSIPAKSTTESQRKTQVGNVSQTSTFIPNRYKKKPSIFKNMSNVQDTARRQQGQGGNSLSSVGRRATISSDASKTSLSAENIGKMNFHFQSANQDKSNIRFSRAANAYKSITKKNASEDSEEQRKYPSIPAASTSASDISCSSTFDSYQNKLAQSLRNANIVTKNSTESSFHSQKSIDDSSIESDIRVLRSILRRPRFNYDHESVITASRQIQGFPTYDTESATDPMQRVGLRLLSSAIIPIQTEVRRFLAMRNALTRMWALIIIQTYTRRFLAQKIYRQKLNSVVTIQAVVRGHIARNEVIDKHICAIEIQRFVRGYLATMQVYEDIYKVTLVQSLVRTRIAMDYAAYRMSLIIQLQAIARGFLSRRRRAYLDKNATQIQSTWRCFYSRLTYQFDLLDIIIVQSLWRRKMGVRVATRKIKERRGNAATLIQAEWRAYDRRMDFIFYMSARTIQTKWRSHTCRLKYIDNRASISIQSVARMFLCRLQYIDYQAAMVIQSLARMYFCRTQYVVYQAATKIQSVGRMYLCRYDYLDYKAATIMQAAIRMYLCRSGYVEYQCASKIQSVGRMYLCRYDYVEYQAATTLQAAVRMYLCRHDYVEYQAATTLQAAVRMYRCRYDYVEYQAATTLQAAVRMYLCRHDYVEYQAATTLQAVVRMYLCRSGYVEYQCASKIQSIGRMYLCRYDYVKYQAAATLQAAIRMYFCRLGYVKYQSASKIQSIGRMFSCRAKYIDFQTTNASTVIQTRWRAYICRKIYIENFAATMIQAKWRSYDCSSMYKRYCSARIIQKTWRSYDCQMNFLHFLADILIVQSTIRRYLVLKRVKAKKDHAATVIQCTWRGFVCFADYEEFKAAREIQNAWRRYRDYNAFKRLVASIKIQSAWRGLICYIDYHEYLTVRRIQSVWRAYICKRNYRREKAAILIQSTWRGFLIYADFMFELSDIIVIQTQIRGWLAKRVANKKRSQLRNDSATTIQNYWRRMAAEMRFLKMKRNNHASTIIQTYWRRFWCFSNFIIALDCSIQIQAQVRGYLQRKKHLSRRFSAITIENAWRTAQAKKAVSHLSTVHEIRNVGKDVAEEQSRAAIKIEKVFRGSLCRNALKVHLAAVLIQSHVRGKQAREAVRLHIAVCKIQAVWRGFFPRKSYLTYIAAQKVHSAAVLIQSHVRGKQARVAVRLYIAVCKLQAVWRGFLPRRSYITYIAARKIQATWRRYNPWQAYINFLAARCIQNSWRCKKAEENLSVLRKEFNAASLIQSVWRGFVCYTDFVFTLSDVVLAQRIVRGYLSRKKYHGTIQSNIAKKKRIRNAGVAIQRIYRGFHSRQNYWYTLGCTMQIQSWWRGRRVYRSFHDKKNAILILQCFLRCCRARQEYMQRRFVFMLIETAKSERSKKLKVRNVQEKMNQDVEEHKLDAAAHITQYSSTQGNHHYVDDLVSATERRKNWRKQIRQEKHSDDMEDALLEDVWTRLVATSDFDEEVPFVRQYTNFGPAIVGGQSQKNSDLVKNDMVRSKMNSSDDATTGCSQFAFPPHPNSSIRMIRKVDAIDMDDDFQLEEAFIDAEIFHAKERRFNAGSNHSMRKVDTRFGLSRGKIPSKRRNQSIMKEKNER